MLNLFPIQFLAPLAYFVLRVILGFVCLRLGLRLIHDEHPSLTRQVMGGLLIVSGSSLVLGLYTQIGALLTLFVCVPGVLRRYPTLRTSRTTLLLMTTIAFTLFITGAGAFAFDLPI